MRKNYTLNGRTYKVYSVQSFGSKHEIILLPDEYPDGSLSLQAWEIDPDGSVEPYSDLTKNLRSDLQDGKHAFVKTYSENEGWAKELLHLAGAVPTGISSRTGYVILPLYDFSDAGIYDPLGPDCPPKEHKSKPGSVLSGTFRPEDLFSAFLHHLFGIDPQACRLFKCNNPELLQALCDHTCGIESPWWNSHEAGYVLDDLFALMNRYSPEGHFFGPHPGNASDFGYWSVTLQPS